MAIRTELSLRLSNSPGSISRACATLSDARVNILALNVESSGVMRVVVDNPVHAAGALTEQHYKVDSKDVLYVIVPNQPGAGQKLAQIIAAAGVNVDYMYGSAVESTSMAAIVIGVADALRAATAAGV